jgi:hypothetical protein
MDALAVQMFPFTIASNTAEHYKGCWRVFLPLISSWWPAQ